MHLADVGFIQETLSTSRYCLSDTFPHKPSPIATCHLRHVFQGKRERELKLRILKKCTNCSLLDQFTGREGSPQHLLQPLICQELAPPFRRRIRIERFQVLAVLHIALRMRCSPIPTMVVSNGVPQKRNSPTSGGKAVARIQASRNAVDCSMRDHLHG